MNKSWKLTVVFAGLLLVLSAAYLLTSPPSATPTAQLQTDRVLGDLTASQISKIEIVSTDATRTNMTGSPATARNHACRHPCLGTEAAMRVCTPAVRHEN